MFRNSEQTPKRETAVARGDLFDSKPMVGSPNLVLVQSTRLRQLQICGRLAATCVIVAHRRNEPVPDAM